MKRGINITYHGCFFLPTVEEVVIVYKEAVMEPVKISVVILHFYMNHNNANVCMEMRFLVNLA